MTSDELLSTITRVFALQAGVEESVVDPDQPAAALKGLESVKLLRAVAEVEDLVGVAIPDDILLDDLTIREFASAVARLPRRGAGR